MSIVLDARPFADAIKPVIKAKLGPNDVYEYGEVPGADGNEGRLPDIFVIVSIERRANPMLRTSTRSGSTGWRLAVRCVGTTVDESRWAQAHAAAALNEARVAVDGSLTTRLQLETTQAPAEDDDRYSATDIYTFAH